jgi:uncharacterized Zn finger protein (UPF0148 family)
MMKCDRCGLPFFDYEGYTDVEDEGIVCSYCVDEEEDDASEERHVDPGR